MLISIGSAPCLLITKTNCGTSIIYLLCVVMLLQARCDSFIQIYVCVRACDLV